MIKLTIESVSNGYIVTTETSAELEKDITVFDTSENQVESVAHVLYHILEMLGETGSRHDAKRIYIEVKPGDKHPDADLEGMSEKE